jgi:pentapeptide MXKDX repeat protein
MNRVAGFVTAVLFALAAAAPAAYAQDQKKAQVHKDTSKQGTVQKKDQKKQAKKDGSGKAKAPAKK